MGRLAPMDKPNVRQCVLCGDDFKPKRNRSGHTRFCSIRCAKSDNLKGERFGELTVLSLAPKDGKGNRWDAQCACGSVCVVTTRRLQAGSQTSCLACAAAQEILDSQARFWAKVNKDGPVHPTNPELGRCWDWTGTTGGPRGPGYGQHGVRKGPDIWRTVFAHRFAYETLVGPVTARVLRHSCDRRICCNPSHLEQGTHADNTRDMMVRGRHRSNPLRGEENNRAKLTDESVREIRTRRMAGESQPALAQAFGVSQATISCIVLRRTWKHVT